MMHLNEVAQEISDTAELISENAAFVAAFMIRDVEVLRRRADAIHEGARLLVQYAYSVTP